ncbi:hypothetical protein [Aulosira sp. FACHB-615]|uniref:hypothetical protein n=1 Tax=Aulosira sp. FACHB-615 TaxID=2692777 RepID=UPI001688B121|nr:hypothetical protein [Aulosira sp. FACHB-615]MBD2492597.1 hypothetical protein [Aulosira sp. FACHB-615]
MTEHQYLRASIIDRFELEYRAIAQLFQPLIAQARLRGDELEVILLKAKQEFLLNHALLIRIRQEEIIYWLEQDTELRKLGTSYAESCEIALWV